MSDISRADRPAKGAVDRRTIVVGAGVIPASAAISLSGHAAGPRWSRFASTHSGAVIRYPASWTLESMADVNLLYPHQSFVLWNGPRPRKSSDEFPSLASYPRIGIYLWLLHYPDVQRSRFAPEFRRLGSHRDLPVKVPEFAGFARFGAAFSGSKHTYLLRLWLLRLRGYDQNDGADCVQNCKNSHHRHASRPSASIRVRSRNHRSPTTACWYGVSFLLPAGVPRRLRSAASRRQTKRSSSAGTSRVAR